MEIESLQEQSLQGEMKPESQSQEISSVHSENIPQKEQKLGGEQDYLKLFETYIYDDNNWKQCLMQPTRAKYRLIEDIAIIYFVGSDQTTTFDSETLGIKFFTQLKHAGFFTTRTIESLRDRYKRYLSCLKGNDIIKIGGWVIENGAIDAFLEFSFFFEPEKMKMIRKLEKIVKVKVSYQSDNETEVEQEEQEQQQQQQLPESEQQKAQLQKTDEKNKNKGITETQLFAEAYIYPSYFMAALNSNKQKIWQLGPYDLFVNEQMFCAQSNYRDVEIQIESNLEGKRYIQKDTQKEEQQLQDQLERICDQFALTKDQALDYLDAVSGNLKDLYYYLRTEENAILWLEEDDIVLKEAKAIDEPAFQLILRQKGPERVKTRMKYKHYMLPFGF